MEGTAYATCLLNVTRAIAMWKPYYQINVKAIVIATAIFVSYVSVKYAVDLAINLSYPENSKVVGYMFYSDLGLVIFSLFLMILVIIISNIITIIHLSKSKLGDKRKANVNKNATVTILILSVLFCLLNVVYVVVGVIELHGNIHGSRPSYYPYYGYFADFACFLAVPLNSALNPAVYILRNRGMKTYVLSLPSSMWGRCFGQHSTKRVQPTA